MSGIIQRNLKWMLQSESQNGGQKHLNYLIFNVTVSCGNKALGVVHSSHLVTVILRLLSPTHKAFLFPDSNWWGCPCIDRDPIEFAITQEEVIHHNWHFPFSRLGKYTRLSFLLFTIWYKTATLWQHKHYRNFLDLAVKPYNSHHIFLL